MLDLPVENVARYRHSQNNWYLTKEVTSSSILMKCLNPKLFCLQHMCMCLHVDWQLAAVITHKAEDRSLMPLWHLAIQYKCQVFLRGLKFLQLSNGNMIGTAPSEMCAVYNEVQQ